MKLKLRAIEPIDADLLYRVENDLAAWAGSDTVAPYSRRILREYALGYDADPFSAGQLRLVAEIEGEIMAENTAQNEGDIAARRPVGILDLYEISALHSRAFVGIYILPEQRGRGYGSKLVRIAVDYARNVLNISIVAARILKENEQSQYIFRKAGFTQIAELPAWHFTDGRFHDLLLFVNKVEI